MQITTKKAGKHLQRHRATPKTAVWTRYSPRRVARPSFDVRPVILEAAGPRPGWRPSRPVMHRSTQRIRVANLVLLCPHATLDRARRLRRVATPAGGADAEIRKFFGVAPPVAPLCWFC